MFYVLSCISTVRLLQFVCDINVCLFYKLSCRLFEQFDGGFDDGDGDFSAIKMIIRQMIYQ